MSDASGVIALLDLPVHTALCIDGRALILRRDDFVGFDQVPKSDQNHFHLITVRSVAPPNKDGGTSQASNMSLGLIILPNTDQWIVARRYNRQTEELGADPVDDLTTSNLLGQIRSGLMEQQRLVPYSRIVTTADAESWKENSKFVSSRLLQKRGINHGDKIVPVSYTGTDDDASLSASGSSPDGKTMSYPPIPVIDSTKLFRPTHHVGTMHYLSKLSPAARTSLLLRDNPADEVFKDILQHYYEEISDDLLGDIQLAFIFFLHLQCCSSLEHWRDLVAMASMAQSSTVKQHLQFYSQLLVVLSNHLKMIERDFFKDADCTEGNFFVPAINRLWTTCVSVNSCELSPGLEHFSQILKARFPSVFEHIPARSEHDTNSGTLDGDYYDEDDNDGPVIVPCDEIEASIARSSRSMAASISAPPAVEYPEDNHKKFPLLFAARMDHEDILMACARILDDANDVSLVREAAAYLEEVESLRT